MKPWMKWTLIWCVRPVFGETTSRESLFPNASTLRQRVLAGFPPVITDISFLRLG